MANSPRLYKHFSHIAPIYTNLRTTDFESIKIIKSALADKKDITGADIGCGSGRYTLELLKNLTDLKLLYCIDNNRQMLRQLNNELFRHHILNFETRQEDATKMSLERDSIDVVFSFNAVHHFSIEDFFVEISRVLKPGGQAFIYTRLKSQNARNIWGQYFPLFAEKENRLYEINEFEQYVTKNVNLDLSQIHFFKYKRERSLKELIKQAKCKHYSTLAFYSAREFRISLRQFSKNIKSKFADLEKIEWLDENVLYVIQNNEMQR